MYSLCVFKISHGQNQNCPNWEETFLLSWLHWSCHKHLRTWVQCHKDPLTCLFVYVTGYYSLLFYLAKFFFLFPHQPFLCEVFLSVCLFLHHTWGFHTFADKALIRLSLNLVDELFMGLPRPNYFLAFHWFPNSASDCWSTFCTFANKLQVRFYSNLLGKLIVGLPRPCDLWAHFTEFSLSWPVICQAVSMHSQTNCWQDWARIQ